MGNALVVAVVPEEFIGGPFVLDANGEPPRLRELYTREEWWPIRNAPEVWAQRHPDAHFPLAIRVADVWDPPSERSPRPGATSGDRWHAHARAVGASLEAFLNARLARLDGMLRTGRWVLDHARVRISAIAGSADADDDCDMERATLEEQLDALQRDLTRLYVRAVEIASVAEESRLPIITARAASIRDRLGSVLT